MMMTKQTMSARSVRTLFPHGYRRRIEGQQQQQQQQQQKEEEEEGGGRRGGQEEEEEEEEEDEEAVEMALETVMPWNSDFPVSLWDNPHELDNYLCALDVIHSFIHKRTSTSSSFSSSSTTYGYGYTYDSPGFSYDSSGSQPWSRSRSGSGSGYFSDSLEKARGAVPLALEQISAVFRRLLQMHSVPVHPDWLFHTLQEEDAGENSTTPAKEDGKEEFRFTIPLIGDQRVIARLASMAERMLACGHEVECRQIYLDVRKPVLERSLRALGFEWRGAEELQRMSWNDLVIEMSKWMQLLRPLVRAVFASEHELCRQIIGGSDTATATVVADIAADAMSEMLHFGQNMAVSERLPERLFEILNMYDALRQVLPDIHLLFATREDIKQEAEVALIKIGEAARATFVAFETAVEQDVVTNPTMGGAVHPMTRYVMNYLRLVGAYVETLTTLLSTRAHQPQEKYDWNPNLNNASSLLSAQVTNLMRHLEKNMDERSKLYRDPALSYIFLLNNMNYIVQKVRDSEMKTLLGDNWIRENLRKLRQYNGHYRKAAWMSVLHCLRDEGIRTNGNFSSGVSKATLKDRFKKFNAAFQEVHQVQSTWIVPDEKLRSEIRISVEEFLLPAYQSFLGHFQSFLEGERHIDRYIKYTPEDIQACLNNLFSGAATSNAGHLSRRRPSGAF